MCVCVCFVFISEQTATCATYNINRLVFITEKKGVFHCHIRAQCLEIKNKRLLLLQKHNVSKNLLSSVIGVSEVQSI